jgi:hypothetical protein
VFVGILTSLLQLSGRGREDSVASVGESSTYDYSLPDHALAIALALGPVGGIGSHLLLGVDDAGVFDVDGFELGFAGCVDPGGVGDVGVVGWFSGDLTLLGEW